MNLFIDTCLDDDRQLSIALVLRVLFLAVEHRCPQRYRGRRKFRAPQKPPMTMAAIGRCEARQNRKLLPRISVDQQGRTESSSLKRAGYSGMVDAGVYAVGL